jgi:hypothetical protein
MYLNGYIVPMYGYNRGGTLYADTFYGNIYRDRDDGGYYIDPTDSGNAMRVRGGSLHGPNPTWGAYLYVGSNGRVDSWASVVTTNGNLHLDPRNGYTTYLNWYAGGPVYVENSIYATIFYDRNNSGYYFGSGEGDTRLNSLSVNNTYINAGYMLYSDSGGWTGEYNKIQWHSSHTYYQVLNNGYHIMRYGGDGLESHQFDRGGNYWNRYMGWMSNYMNQNVRTDASPTFYDLYVNGWFRNNTNGHGLYNQNRGMHWYTNNGYWKAAGGGYGYGGVVMYNNYESDLRGYLYWDGSGFGLLNNSGNWQVRIEYGNAHMELYRVTYADDMRAYIHYDRNNTGYYFGSGDGGTSVSWLDSNNHYIRPGYMLFGDMGGWTGEYNKIQWHSAHLYFQQRSGGYFIMRRTDGNDRHYFAEDGNYWNAYMGWMSNYMNQNVRTDASPTFQEVYANGWFRNQGGGGLYQQSYGGHFRANFQSSYTPWETFGNYRSGYGGQNFNDPSGYHNNVMFESGNGGIYNQQFGWTFYYSRGNNCASFDSTTYGFVRFNVERGGSRVRQFVNYNYNCDGNMDMLSGFGLYLRSSGGYNLVLQTDGWNNVYALNGGGSYGGVYLSPYNYAWYGYSDINYKDIRGVVTDVLDKVDTLTPIYFTYKLHSVDPEHIPDTNWKLGLIAQEVQQAFPEAVRVDEKTGILTLAYDNLIPVLVQSVKELRNEINLTKAQIEYLLHRVDNLENN